MATLAFKSYIYKPTPPRSKSAATRPRPAPERVSTFNKLQHIMSSGALVSAPRTAAVAAADDGGHQLGIRGTGTIYGRSDKENDDETDDDRDLPTIEELLLTKLQAQGFTTEDRGPDETGRVEGVALEEKGGSVDQSNSAQSNDLGGSPDDPLVLLGDDDSSASAAEADDINPGAAELDAGLFDSPENPFDSTTPAPPRSSDRWHDIDDSLERAPPLRLAEQGASTPDSLPHLHASRLSSEPLHDSTRTENFYTRRAKSEATTSYSARPQSPLAHCARTSSESQLSQEGPLHTGRGVANEHGLVNPALDTFPVEEERGQLEVEQEEGEDDEDGGLRQEVNDVAAAVTSERVDGAGSDSHRDDELNNTDLDDDDDEEPRPMKRKRPSPSCGGPVRKKRKHRLQQRPTRRYIPHSKLYVHSPKSHSLLDQGSTVTAVSSTEGRLSSPTPSAPYATDTDMSPDCCNLDRLSKATLPTLTEVTFRPHSPHCCSFTAVVRDGCAERGVSFSQVVRLIASIGHVGKIDGFTIKPAEQNSVLLTGFSRRTSSRPSFSGTTLSTAAELGRDRVDATRNRPREGRAVDFRALASQRSKPSLGEDDGGLSDSDSESNSNNDGCSSEDEQGRSSTSKHSRWSDLDEQRLLAYKKEDKSWEWIFGKFPGRTRAAVRTRWNMVRPRGE